MRKNRLLLVGTNTIHTYNFIRLIDGYFDEILLVTNSKREGENVNVILFDFSLRNPFQIKHKVDQLKKIIIDYNPDLIHIHQANTCSFYTLMASSNMKLPTVVTAWGSDILYAPQRGWLYKKMVKYVLQHADAFTSDSSYMAEVMRSMLPGKKLNILIANFGIDIINKDSVKENIIYSNRQLQKLYRINEVIIAFDRFLKSNEELINSWQLVIAATGDEEHSLKELAHTLGIQENVLFTGWLNKEQNSEWYAKSKLFISIPESDATAISLLEAMYAGCIPVVADLPANREWIIDRKNGYIVNDYSEDFISKALVLNQQEVAQHNRKLIEELATKEVNRKKFLSLYDNLLNAK